MARPTDNWYSYKFVKPRALGDRVEPKVFGDVLGWAVTNLWSKKHDEVSQAEFEGTLNDFCFRKADARAREFEQRSGPQDCPAKINGSIVGSARDPKDLWKIVESSKVSGLPIMGTLFWVSSPILESRLSKSIGDILSGAPSAKATAIATWKTESQLENE